MMYHRTLCPFTQQARGLALAFAIMLCTPLNADIVNSIDQGMLGGDVTLAQGEDTLTLTDSQGKQYRLPIQDIDEVQFNRELSDKPSGQELLINGDRGTGNQSNTGKVKLRAGLHRITIPYWQADGEHKLMVSVSGPGINGSSELGADHLHCFRNADEAAEASIGKDEQGYRLPELTLKDAEDRRRFLTRARYRMYTGDQGVKPQSVADLARMQIKRSGTTSAINTGVLNDPSENVGLVFDAFFKADIDGEYTFILVSNDGAQLYLGQVDQFAGGMPGAAPVHTPWRAELAHQGKAQGELKTIADQTLTFHVPLVSDVTLSLSHLRAVWDNKVDPALINRDNEPANEDTVYLRDKSDPKIVRSVSGKINTLTDESLAFEFRGEERTITRDRVVGMVFKHASRAALPDPGLHQILEIRGGQVLPCKVLAIGKHIAFELIGGGQAAPPREVVQSMRIENGRRIDLTRTAPSAEEAIAYFGLTLPHKVNMNFAGKPITLYDEKTYDRGLAVHSKSRLHYKLKPNCERFQATFGLMAPNGKLGNVTARVIGDGQVLWQQENITAQSRSIQVDVPLQNVERLILEVDFGRGQDVGDRAAWCNPRLIYGSAND